MSRSFRIFYKDVHGRIPTNFNLSGVDVTNKSAVVVTVGQWTPPAAFFDLENVRLQVHGPDVWTTNICPHGSENEASGVEFMLHVDSPTPINVAATITVFEECEGFFHG
jgi:hypothetical protein